MGFCLLDDSTDHELMIGYFGCFTYHRKFAGINYQFYNTHTWIVKPEYRRHSLKLLMPYLRLNSGIVTNFSANEKVAQILEQFKFSKITIVNNVLKLSFSWKTFLAQRKLQALPLSHEITKWHEAYECLCIHLSFSNSKERIELILKPIVRMPKWVKGINQLTKLLFRKPLITKSYFLHKVHYVSDADLLIKHYNAIAHYLFLKKKVAGLILPETIINTLPKNFISSRYEDEVYVRSNLEQLAPIDYLYSEVFYLNISDK